MNSKQPISIALPPLMNLLPHHSRLAIYFDCAFVSLHNLLNVPIVCRGNGASGSFSVATAKYLICDHFFFTAVNTLQTRHVVERYTCMLLTLSPELSCSMYRRYMQYTFVVHTL
jgi:hypothetical protein